MLFFAIPILTGCDSPIMGCDAVTEDNVKEKLQEAYLDAWGLNVPEPFYGERTRRSLTNAMKTTNWSKWKGTDGPRLFEV